MAAISAYAPGKIILFGEHAVVYGRHAIAIPVTQVQARAAVFPLIHGKPGFVQLISDEVHLNRETHDLPETHPLRKTVDLTLQAMNIPIPPAMQIRISSTIPIGGGLGSGAAVSVALVRAISTFLGKTLPKETTNQIAYEVEKIHHGTPSGIDNTVITYSMPVLFAKGEKFQFLTPGGNFSFLIVCTGIRASTGEIVEGVRQRRSADPDLYERWFDRIDQLTANAVHNLQIGDAQSMGQDMYENHTLLQQMGVSSDILDHLVDILRKEGALGAKLSGAGVGGNVIALIPPEQTETFRQHLLQKGFDRVYLTRLESAPCSS